MKTRLAKLGLGLAVLMPAMTQAQSQYDDLARLPYHEGYLGTKDVLRLQEELFFQRAVQTYLWALPALNMYGMKEGSEKAFGKGYNILPIFKKRLDAKTLITTPNSFFDQSWKPGDIEAIPGPRRG